MANIKLLGRIFIHSDIKALTGLHIGGNGAALEIGGLDNPVIRNAITREPYIPGSSLRGKMRSQLEKQLGSPQNQKVGQAMIHVCKGEDSNHPCDVCKIFGLSASEKNGTPTRLLVRDVSLTEASRDELMKARTDQLFTETKSEVAIDRVTSAASPRNIERVPAGAVFGPSELVFSLYEPDDLKLLDRLLGCLQLTEDDYLGGGGSRGNGKVCFENIEVSARFSDDYNKTVELGKYSDIQELEAGFPDLKKKVSDRINRKG